MQKMIFGAFALSAIAIAGCAKVRNGTAESDTLHRLKNWPEAIHVALQVNDDIRTYKNLSEFVAAWKKKAHSVVACVSADYTLNDVWGQPIELRILTYSDDLKQVRILSLGKDGISQDGEGDDLYVEVILQKGAKPIWKVKGE